MKTPAGRTKFHCAAMRRYSDELDQHWHLLGLRELPACKTSTIAIAALKQLEPHISRRLYREVRDELRGFEPEPPL